VADIRLASELNDKNNLKILFLSQYFYPEQFLNNHITEYLVKCGHVVDVISCVPNYPGGKFYDGYSNFNITKSNWKGVTIHRVFTVPRGRSAIKLVLNYIVYPLAASWKIVNLAKARRPNVSFVSMPSPLFQALAGIFAKRMFGVPTVYWVQDIWPDSPIITLGLKNRLIIRLLNSFCGWIYRQADIVMVQSDGFHKKIEEFGVDPSRLVTLSNSAPDFFKPMKSDTIPDRIRAIVPRNRKTLMFAGNIGESQDFDTIIAAARLLPAENDLVIIVIGSGRDEERVKKKVANEGLSDRFVFLGQYPETDMPSFFACADAMLVSLRDEPIFTLTVPSKVQAYLACGKPIIANMAGEGASVIQKARAGLTVSPGSPKALSQAMISVTSMQKIELENMGLRGRNHYVANFALPAITEKLITHLQRVAL
jgi:colanic acid biosynthesis glycosyl transferase WcaI